MRKTLVILWLSTVATFAQPNVPYTTPWSRLFLRSTNGILPVATATNASWGYYDRYGSNLFRFVPIGGSFTNYFDLFIGDFTPTNSYGRPTTNGVTDIGVNIGDTIIRQNSGGFFAVEFGNPTNSFWYYQGVWHVGDLTGGSGFSHQMFDQSANFYPSNVMADGSIVITDGTKTFSGNGNGITNLPNPTLVLTNWISGFVYTNASGRIQHVQVAVSCTAASVAGGAVVRLQSGATQAAMTTIAQFGQQTISGSLVVTNTGTITGNIASGNIFSFTNLVGGAGDSAINLPGTGQQLTY